MSFTRFKTFNAVLPSAGPVVYPQTLNFDQAGGKVERTLDFTPEVTAGNIEYISGVYVDNRTNPNPLEIETGQIGQKVSVPAGKQAYMPLFVGEVPTLTFRGSGQGGLYIPVFVCNFPVWPIIF